MSCKGSKLLSSMLALCMVLALLPGTALAAETSGDCGENVTWSYKDGTLIIEGTGSMDDADVSSDFPWYSYQKQIHTVTIEKGVTAIGAYAFAGSNLTKVTIPNTVTSIGDGAFGGCENLTGVTIPDSVETIGDGAFSGCESLADVSISNGVTYIGNAVFSNCESLTSVTIPDSVTRIGDSVFSGCKNLTSVTLPESFPPFSSSTVFSSGFKGCFRLTSVTIPEGVTRIGGSAFESCSRLTYVVLPESLTSVDAYAFHNCLSLTDVYFSGGMFEWFAINVSNSNNEPLLNAVVHYNNGTGPSLSDPLSTPETPSTPAGPSAPVPEKVMLSPQNLAVDGREIDCEKYNIDGSNYFKLRDLAQLLSGTGSQFEVSYDAAASAVTITTGAAYTPAGGELATGVDNSSTAQPSAQSILIDGAAHGELTVYNIGGSNFFQLRELGNLLGFEVGYDLATNTATVSSR